MMTQHLYVQIRSELRLLYFSFLVNWGQPTELIFTRVLLFIFLNLSLTQYTEYIAFITISKIDFWFVVYISSLLCDVFIHFFSFLFGKSSVFFNHFSLIELYHVQMAVANSNHRKKMYKCMLYFLINKNNNLVVQQCCTEINICKILL